MIATQSSHRVASITQELDAARHSGALERIVIPPCPELLRRLQDALNQTEPDLNEVARVAASDVAMSATLLTHANSALYGGASQPARTIGQALNRLGLERAASVMTGFLAQRAIRANSPHLQRFWERAAKCAQAMSFIAHKLPGMSPDVAHTYGLFCHVGMPVMMQCVSGYAGTIVEAKARIDRSFIATENANHRTDHAVVGALVTRVWRLAPEVTAAIRLHHDWTIFDDDDGGAEPQVKTLVAAGLIADDLMRHHEGIEADADWQQHAATAMRWLSITADDLQQWEEEVLPTLDVL